MREMASLEPFVAIYLYWQRDEFIISWYVVKCSIVWAYDDLISKLRVLLHFLHWNQQWLTISRFSCYQYLIVSATRTMSKEDVIDYISQHAKHPLSVILLHKSEIEKWYVQYLFHFRAWIDLSFLRCIVLASEVFLNSYVFHSHTI